MTSSHWHLDLGRIAMAMAVFPLAYYLAATVAALRFFRAERARKLPSFAPPVSLLKPVRGVDSWSYESFRSFCTQDYPEYEILFAVNEEADPAVPLIRQLAAEFPDRGIRLLVGATSFGSNRKVNKLVRLAEEARNEILVLSDGDVRADPGYLREVVAPFQDPATGAVTCFYRAITDGSFWARIEAIGASSDFFAGVLMARWLEGMSFALGASIATSKTWLARIGGFAPIAQMHSDDYELGNRIAKAGGRVLLSREPVWTTYPAVSLRGFWDHQVRWARTVRLSRPASYVGLLLTHGLPWAILAAALAPAKSTSALFLAAYLGLRLWMAWVVGIWGVRDAVLKQNLWLVPLRDALHFAVWLASFASSRITWGGEEFTMHGDQMVRVASGTSGAGAREG